MAGKPRPRARQAFDDNIADAEIQDIFAVFPPGSRLTRDAFGETALRPLLRQALVAACAAVETFVGDRVMERLSDALAAYPRPPRLLQLPMTVGDWLEIDETYERPGWGLRHVIHDEVRRRVASPAPSQIGLAFSLIGETKVWKRVDDERRVASGTSSDALERIYRRRNVIAHQGDRKGHGRATISADEVDADIACIVSIVDALDRVVPA
jgi:hypothetical protein